MKQIPTGSHIMAAPMTYTVHGRQYVAVQVGYGGAAIGGAIPPQSAAIKYDNVNRIIAFKLGGGPVPIPPARLADAVQVPPANTGTQATIRQGQVKFAEECARCHVFTPRITPNLVNLPKSLHGIFNEIVLKGILAPAGMERFDDILTPQDVDAIHAYLIDTADTGYASRELTGSH